MRQPRTRKPVEWRQLCAIVREVITAEPTMDDFEWAERVKQRIVDLELTYPTEPHKLSEAMAAVERALVRKWGPRPVEDPRRATGPVSPVPPPPPPLAWASVQAVIARVRARTADPPSNASARPSAPLSATPAVPLAVAEAALLDAFYQACTATPDRLTVLRACGDLAIAREATWDVAREQALAASARPTGDRCFVCRSGDRGLVVHHVIPVARGGSAHPRNRVSICDACDADLHPERPKGTRRLPGWSSLADLIGGAAR
jgi:HNH endonuclease